MPSGEPVHLVLAPNPGPMTLTGTNTWVIDGGAGQLAVVDPGPDDPSHLEAILRFTQPLGTVTHILVTHGHSDHLPAAGPLSARTGASIAGHRQLPGVQRRLTDQEHLRVGRLSLVALETPGHTDDSLCYWLEPEGARALFTGDLIAGSGTVIVDEAPGGLSSYMRSLARVRSLGVGRIYPGHGPIVADGPAKIDEYLAHRTHREEQLVRRLRESGPATVEELVAAIYPDVTPALVPMAARNVRAHLGKLRDEARVLSDGSRWRLAA